MSKRKRNKLRGTVQKVLKPNRSSASVPASRARPQHRQPKAQTATRQASARTSAHAHWLPCPPARARHVFFKIVVELLGLSLVVGFSTTNFTRAGEPTLLWNHYTHLLREVLPSAQAARYSRVFRIAAAKAASTTRAINFCPDWLGWMSHAN
jgi:hypothetical protein